MNAKTIMLKSAGFLLISLLLCSIIVLFAPTPTAQAEPWNVPAQGSYLTPKWVGYVAGGGEAIVTADVNSSIPGEEVFHAGGPAQPSSTAGRVTCLNAQDGTELWRKSIYGVGDTATLQMADVDLDGKLEIAVALQAPAGLYILNAEDGSELWKAPGSYTYEGNVIGGFITPIGGRVDGSGVIGDIDGDGYPTVFLGVMAYEENPDSGKLIAWEWNPTLGTMVEQARTTVWHPCAGGLSLGDTDNDGTFELYMNERDVYYGDGSHGRGLTSFWAENLTLRWRIYDWGASSNIPMLADINKDGVLDVVDTNLGTGICVLNSTDGQPLKGAGGVVLYNQQLGLPVHYQSTIYDIDGDGNLELMCADGTHVASGMGFISNYTMIWDLYNWQLDGVLNPGLAFRGPSVGEVTGDGVMDIIVATYNESGTDYDAVKIYDHSYSLVDQYVGLRRPAIGTVVQDIDRDDTGLNELLVLTQGGIIYCFDTPGLSQERLGNQRARSEVHFYSESRNGVSEYIPYERPYPDVAAINPSMEEVNVSTSLSQLSFQLKHPLGETMSYTVTTTPNIGSGSASDVGDGIRTITVSGLSPSTLYKWQVNATDQTGHKTSQSYWFRTAPFITNSAPTQGVPLLNGTLSQIGVNDSLTCFNQSTADVNGNPVTNVYNWQKNGAPMASLNLPFESEPDEKAVYSGYAVTRDYSGRGNNGTVFGATWLQGKVGGAFSFDGNDFIRIEERSNSLGGDGSWSQITVECWLKATTTMTDKPVIWKTDRYETNHIGYRLDCGANLTASSMKLTWYVYSQSNVYNVTCTLSSGVTDWHHIVCTYKSGIGLRIYIDGSQNAYYGPTPTGNINATDGPVELAFNSALDLSTVVDYPSYLAAIRDFTGCLDEVRVYSFEISSVYVNQRYLETKDGLSDKSSIPGVDIDEGDDWVCQVTPNDGLTDGQTMTSTTPQETPYIIFEDGFESGSFNAWNGTTQTTGGTSTVTSINPYSGAYSGQYAISSGTGTRRAYSYVTLDNLEEVYAWAYVYIPSGFTLANGQKLFVIQFVDSSGSALASYGAIADSSGARWAVQYAGWPSTVGASIPSNGGWYLLQAYFTHASSGPTLVLSVNDVEAVSLSYNTSASNPVASARFGQTYYTGSNALTVNIDDARVGIRTGDFEYLGFSGYITSGAELENTVALMENESLNVYRVSFKPSWEVPEGELRGYDTDYIDYLLDNTNFFIVVDGNHLYPRESQSIYAQNHWDLVRDRVFQILQDYPNNSRVAVELINEYAQSDYDAKTQALISEVRAAGYTNPLVTNKLTTPWLKFSDPLDNTYQGMHFYFNHWEASEAIAQIDIALSRGITKILNTEIGANSDEYEAFTQQYVDELETYLTQSQMLGVNDCIWMNDDTENWQGYTEYDFTFNTPTQNPTIAFFSQQDNAATSNLGSLTIQTVNHALPYTTPIQSGTYTVEYSSATGFVFDRWETTGAIIVTDINSASTTITVSGDCTLTAIYVEAPQQSAYLVVRGLENQIWYREYDVASTTWGEWSALPSGMAYDSVATTVCNGKLYMTTQAMDGMSLWFSWVDLTDNNFSGWTAISGLTPSPPTLVSDDDKLYVLVRGLENQIWIRNYDCMGEVWGEWSALPSGACPDSIAASIRNGNLYMVVQGMDGLSLWFSWKELTDGSFSNWIAISGLTPSAPRLA